jgi:hypothetical protein
VHGTPPARRSCPRGRSSCSAGGQASRSSARRAPAASATSLVRSLVLASGPHAAPERLGLAARPAPMAAAPWTDQPSSRSLASARSAVVKPSVNVA